MFFVSATSFFEFADPQLDGTGDFSRALTTGLFLLVELRLGLHRSSMFDNSDLVIHDFSPVGF